jgi:predicted dehydrogenase
MFDSIREGKVGVPLMFRSERLSPLNRNVDGSLLWSLAPHDLSVLHALDPSAVKKVEADPSLLGRDGVFNQVDLKLHFGSGLRAHITVSTAHHRKVRRMQVIGQEGTMVFDDVGREPTLLLIRGDRMERVAFDTSLPPLRAEVDAFVHCVRKRRQPETGFLQGRDVVALIERTQQIIREKCPKQGLHLSGSVF